MVTEAYILSGKTSPSSSAINTNTSTCIEGDVGKKPSSTASNATGIGTTSKRFSVESGARTGPRMTIESDKNKNWNKNTNTNTETTKINNVPGSSEIVSTFAQMQTTDSTCGQISESIQKREFQRFTVRTPSFITVTLSASVSASPIPSISSGRKSTSSSKRELLRMQWEETCMKWGLVVRRELTYVQDLYADIAPESKHEQNLVAVNNSSNEDSERIKINGYDAIKKKDELIISTIYESSYAHSAGIREGDVVSAVYGMKDPNLGLLFGIMRDSMTFQLTVKRMETEYQRDIRVKGHFDMAFRDGDVDRDINGAVDHSRELTLAQTMVATRGQTTEIYSNVEEPSNQIAADLNRIRANAVQECMRDLDPEWFQYSDDNDDDNIISEKATDGDINDIVLRGNDILSSPTTDQPCHSQQETNHNQMRDGNGKQQSDSDELQHKSNDQSKKGSMMGLESTRKSNKLRNPDANEMNADKYSTGETKNNRGVDPSDRGLRRSCSDTDPNHSFTSPQYTKNGEMQQRRSSREEASAIVSETLNKEMLMEETYLDPSRRINDITKSTEKNGSEHPHTAVDLLNPTIPTGAKAKEEEEELLTSLIEKSIESEENKCDKKTRKKKKRKMSEDSTKSASSRKKKISKSKRKECRKDYGVNELSKVDSRDENKTKRHQKDKTKNTISLDASNNDNTSNLKTLTRQKESKTSKSNGKPPRNEPITDQKEKDLGVSGACDVVTQDGRIQNQTNEGTPKAGSAGETRSHSTASSTRQRVNSVSSMDFSISVQNDDDRRRPHRASPLTIPRASPVTVLRQHSKVTVSSKSSKAGLGTIKSAKLKRLWPDSSVFSKRILKWHPPSVIQEDFKVLFKGPAKSNIERHKLPVIPSTFRDTSEIIKFMSPHILEEGIHSVGQEFVTNSDGNGIWSRDVFSMQLRHCTPVDPKTTATSSPCVRTYEFSFRLDSNNGLQPPTNLGEIFVLHSPSWKQECCLGIIGSNDINSTFLADQKVYDDDDSKDLFKLWVCVCGDPLDETGWLPETDMPPKNPDGSFAPQTMFVMNIGTCTDMMRQYEGLKSLATVRSNLKKIIFTSETDSQHCKEGEIIDSLQSEKLSKPTSICSTIWDQLKKSTNPFQLSAIERIMSGKMPENIALLQGPPGTGKTCTTVNLVSALLNGSAPVPGMKSSGTRVQIGRALQNSSSGNIKHNSVVARRILVCAPSNQAVDELAWKIHKSAIGGNGKLGGFNMVRFGMLPGEDRHDGRGKRFSQRASSIYGNERDRFLSAINLDKMVRDVASGRESHDFRHTGDNRRVRNDDASRNNRKSRYINYSVERQKILSQCHVVCSTLSGAGSKAFIESVSRDEFPQSEFDAVIIDEACQGSEMSCLIPFKYNPNVVVLVGDPNQLPVMTFSQEATRCNADRSLFDRFHEIGLPINMLRIQYRMHPAIVQFPSRTFYDDKIITCDRIRNRRPAIWHEHIAFPPYLLWDSQGGVMSRGKNGGISNNAEANFVLRLLKAFAYRYRNVGNINIGIISFYSEQVAKIKDKVKDQNLLNWMNSNNISLQISTVDGFQGSEKDIIILSCVRSKWMDRNVRSDVGFLKDFRRVNVALTRAKYSLWVVAHCETLSKDALWNDLINDAYGRNLISKSNELGNYVDQKPKRKQNKGSRKKKKNS